ncbi:hypothetical protein P3T25_007358, partial [Paraburkholderia sp. GAS32]
MSFGDDRFPDTDLVPEKSSLSVDHSLTSSA